MVLKLRREKEKEKKKRKKSTFFSDFKAFYNKKVTLWIWLSA